MIHSKSNTNGFTLLEVLFALSILGMILTPLVLNQSRLLGRIAFQSTLLYRTYVGEKFMLDSYVKFEQDNKQRKATKSIDDPETTVTFRIIEPSPTIKKLFRDLYRQEVFVEWEEAGIKNRDSLISFLFLPELEKK